MREAGTFFGRKEGTHSTGENFGLTRTTSSSSGSRSRPLFTGPRMGMSASNFYCEENDPLKRAADKTEVRPPSPGGSFLEGRLRYRADSSAFF